MPGRAEDSSTARIQSGLGPTLADFDVASMADFAQVVTYGVAR